MLKHAAIVAVAVVSAIGAAQGLTAFAGSRAPLPAPAQAQSLLPDAGAAAPQAAQVSKAADGHYWAQANVNGRWIRFLVDTGASAVALTGADAQRLGLDLDSLDYTRPVNTASGQTKAAVVKLDQVTVAGARVEDVDALVVRDGLSTSLLGMSYLGRLSRFEATKTALILRP
jgi:aspartyl protease family protein